MGVLEIRMPSLDANEDEAVITAIYKKDRDYVETGDLLFSVENSKTTCDITADVNGYLKLMVSEYDRKKTGEAIALLFDSLEEFDNHKADESSKKESTINATRKAIELAGKLDVDLEEISKVMQGRLIKEKDVNDFARNKLDDKPVTSSKPVFRFDRERVVIIGAGLGAEVVIDILLDDHDKEIVGLVDDNVKKMLNYSFEIFDCNISSFPDDIDRGAYDTVIISIGANKKSMEFRDEVYKKYIEQGISFTNAIDRTAVIRRGVKLGKGNIIGSGCYIGTLSQIGNNNSISYGANIGHHNIVGDSNLIGPGVFTSGSDIIGSGCIFPAGVHIINRIKIGDKVIVPLGYDIAGNIEDGTVIKSTKHS